MSIVGDKTHDPGVPGCLSKVGSEGATPLDVLHRVGCECLLFLQGVQELS